MKNIRWELYKQAQGIKSDEDVKSFDYIAWIIKKWDKYRKLHLEFEGFTSQENAEFNEWLRNEVQGANR